ncbi:hypothetical protein ACIBI9_64790 [Nonomuraea sp. NPDC050451]|uniref:hypothetical protein n=1 Tax=Nonomuraea sp. NPDC050451 TaxID=3364364 RepID=UPI0037A2C248
MVQDYPPAIRDRYGPKSPRGQRVARLASLIVAVGVVAILALALTHLNELAPGSGRVRLRLDHLATCST